MESDLIDLFGTIFIFIVILIKMMKEDEKIECDRDDASYKVQWLK